MLAISAKKRKHAKTCESDNGGVVPSSKAQRVTAVEHATAATRESQNREPHSEERKCKQIAGCERVLDKNNRSICNQERKRVELQQEAEAANSESISQLISQKLGTVETRLYERKPLLRGTNVELARLQVKLETAESRSSITNQGINDNERGGDNNSNSSGDEREQR